MYLGIGLTDWLTDLLTSVRLMVKTQFPRNRMYCIIFWNNKKLNIQFFKRRNTLSMQWTIISWTTYSFLLVSTASSFRGKICSYSHIPNLYKWTSTLLFLDGLRIKNKKSKLQSCIFPHWFTLPIISISKEWKLSISSNPCCVRLPKDLKIAALEWLLWKYQKMVVLQQKHKIETN